MCLAIPGRILAITSQPPDPVSADPVECPEDDPLWRVAQVDFGGVRQQVSLACLPQAQVGDRVLVHVGLAIALVQEDEGPHGRCDATTDPGTAPRAELSDAAAAAAVSHPGSIPKEEPRSGAITSSS